MSFQLYRGRNQWRFDPVTQRHSLIATNRRLLAPEVGADFGPCPFCGPDPLPSLHAEHDVIALPAKTPLCAVEDAAPPSAPFTHTGALGAHEVIVPLGEAVHHSTLATLSHAHLAGICRLFARRVVDLSRDPRLRSVALSLAPTTARLSHLHGALLASPFVAPSAHVDDCTICADQVAATAGGRDVIDHADWQVWVPYAPSGAIHVRLAPRRHGDLWRLLNQLDQEPDKMGELASAADALATLIATVAQRCERLMPGIPLALTVPPLALRPESDGRTPHLFIELEQPRPTDAVLNAALGISICEMPPEELAVLLRTAGLPASA